MYKITEELATHGLGEPAYPMDEMQMAQAKLENSVYLDGTDFFIVDIRDMLDEPQPKDTYMVMIARAMVPILSGFKIVICCGAGQSRSNAIAIGVLMDKYKMNFYDAQELVRQKVPIAQIEPCHISALKQIYNVGPP